MKVDENEIIKILEYWSRKLCIIPHWDIQFEFVYDINWRKTGDIKIDCDDRKVVLILNASNPKQENL